MEIKNTANQDEDDLSDLPLTYMLWAHKFLIK